MIATAALTAVVAFLQSYISAKDSDAAKRQIGTLEYENIAQAQAIAQAAAAKRTAEVIQRLSDADLALRMRNTNDAISKAQS